MLEAIGLGELGCLCDGASRRLATKSSCPNETPILLLHRIISVVLANTPVSMSCFGALKRLVTMAQLGATVIISILLWDCVTKTTFTSSRLIAINQG